MDKGLGFYGNLLKIKELLWSDPLNSIKLIFSSIYQRLEQSDNFSNATFSVRVFLWELPLYH